MAVVVVHHLNKQIGPVDPFDLISGPRADMGCYSIVSSARASIAGAVEPNCVLLPDALTAPKKKARFGFGPGFFCRFVHVHLGFIADW